MIFTLPPHDRSLSPYTGYTREHWAAVADHMLEALQPYFSSTRARIELPGRVSSSGPVSDALEGFARSFLLFGFRLVGEGGSDPKGFLPWYRDGLIAGTDPANPERWPLPGELDQAKVEAASIALILQLTRPWLWDTLSQGEQQNVINWFATAVGTEYPPNNWLWFRLTVETFLASVGGPYLDSDIRADLDLHESFYREGGWYSDGHERAYDFYCGWAMQLYPLLWADSPGADQFGARELKGIWRNRLSHYLDDYIHLIGADGVPLLQGRSLIYRFAAAGPLWMRAYTGATNLEPGQIRRGASGILKVFVEHGALDERGLLTMGLFGEWPKMAQTYSGAGSPYWAAKGMLGLALPAHHPVWQSVEESLPVERADTRRVIAAPGWLVAGTKGDGIVRVLNHGTDHARPGDDLTDSPIYARLGYSSATIPPLVGETVLAPADNSIAVVDSDGRVSHRTGFVSETMGDDGAACFATSRARSHWVEVAPGDGRDHGSGQAGKVTYGPEIVMASLARGAWEVRVAWTQSAAQRLRFTGWPLAGGALVDAGPTSTGHGYEARVGRLGSVVEPVVGDAIAKGHRIEEGVSPLGEKTVTPYLDFGPVASGQAVAVAVKLTGEQYEEGGGEVGSDGQDRSGQAVHDDNELPQVAIRMVGPDCAIDVQWAPGLSSSLTLPLRRE